MLTRNFNISYVWCLYTALFTIIQAENINRNSNTQNKNMNKLLNIVQLRQNTLHVYQSLTKDVTEDALGKFPHKFRLPFQYYTLNIVTVKYLHTMSDNV